MHAPPDTPFTGFDWFLVVLLAISILAAFQRGFIRAILSLAGVVVGILAASWNFLEVAVRLQRWIASFAICELLAFLLILVLVMAVFTIAATVLAKTVKAVGLGFLDRLLGAAFGLVRGILIGVAAIMAATAFFPDSGWLRHSVLTPYFLGEVHAVSFVVPGHFQQQIADGVKHLFHETPNWLRIDR